MLSVGIRHGPVFLCTGLLARIVVIFVSRILVVTSCGAYRQATVIAVRALQTPMLPATVRSRLYADKLIHTFGVLYVAGA